MGNKAKTELVWATDMLVYTLKLISWTWMQEIIKYLKTSVSYTASSEKSLCWTVSLTSLSFNSLPCHLMKHNTCVGSLCDALWVTCGTFPKPNICYVNQKISFSLILIVCIVPSAIKRMPWDYPESTMISQWSPWTELSSGLSMSCATKEPSTFAQLCMTSAGSSTTLWMWSGSYWSVWQRCYSSWQNVASFAAIRLVTWERRKRSSVMKAEAESPERGASATCFQQEPVTSPGAFPLKQDTVRTSLKMTRMDSLYEGGMPNVMSHTHSRL